MKIKSFPKQLFLALAAILPLALLSNCGSNDPYREVDTGAVTFTVASDWTDSDFNEGGKQLDSSIELYTHFFITGKSNGKDTFVFVNIEDYSNSRKSPDKTFEEYFDYIFDSGHGEYTIEDKPVIDDAIATRFSFDYKGEDKAYGLYLVKGELRVFLYGTDKEAVDAVIETLHLK